MAWPRNLLWVDGIGGTVGGVAVLLARNCLSEWYRLPLSLLLVIGFANLAYGAYALSLAARSRRPKAFIWLLIAANLTWTLLCWRWTMRYAEIASWLGLAHLFLEGLYVGGLALLEWRWREQLL